MFAGIAGAEIALDLAGLNPVAVWQSDLVGEAVRARHFPDAAQLVGDVREIDPARLPAVDLLTAGFPCQDLSVAGGQAGLDGARSGLYSEVLRFTKTIRPDRVLIENVPALLHYLPRLGADFRALGYGLTWTVCEAADAGLPHLRRRVFVLAERDSRGRGAVEVDQAGRWQPPSYTEDEAWNIAADAMAKQPPWRDLDESDEEDPDVWGLERERRAADVMLDCQARTWPTPVTRDYKTGDLPNRRGTEALSSAGAAPAMGLYGRRLSPAWVEALMGYPLGWTAPDAGPLSAADIPPPVRGRYPEGWDRSTPWPGFDWEPARTLPDGEKMPGRAARIRGLGNAWSPPQAALAIRALWGQPDQLQLF